MDKNFIEAVAKLFDAVDSSYNYVVQDFSGCLYAFKFPPIRSITGNWETCDSSKFRGFCDRQSEYSYRCYTRDEITREMQKLNQPTQTATQTKQPLMSAKEALALLNKTKSSLITTCLETVNTHVLRAIGDGKDRAVIDVANLPCYTENKEERATFLNQLIQLGYNYSVIHTYGIAYLLISFSEGEPA